MASIPQPPDTLGSLRRQLAVLERAADSSAVAEEAAKTATAKEYLARVQAEETLALVVGQRDRLSAQLDEARATIDRAIDRFAAPHDPPVITTRDPRQPLSVVIAESNIPGEAGREFDTVEELTTFLDDSLDGDPA